MLYWNKTIPCLQNNTDSYSAFEEVEEKHISEVLRQEFTDADSESLAETLQDYLNTPQIFIQNILTEIFYAVRMDKNALDALVKRLRRKLNRDLYDYGIIKYPIHI